MQTLKCTIIIPMDNDKRRANLPNTTWRRDATGHKKVVLLLLLSIKHSDHKSLFQVILLQHIHICGLGRPEPEHIMAAETAVHPCTRLHDCTEKNVV
jgi:hypothetical protein